MTLAIDVGGSWSRAAIVRDGVIGERVAFATSDLARPRGGVVDQLVIESRSLVASTGFEDVDAIGIGLAAYIDVTGSVLQPRDFGIPGGSVVRDAFARAFGSPVLVDNDANLAALAECRLGAGRGRATVAVLTLGTNIGLGLVFDGRIHRGRHGAAGEAGLLLVPAAETGRRIDDRPVVDAGAFGCAPSSGPSGYAWVEDLAGGRALAASLADLEGNHRLLASATLDDPATRPLAARAIEGWAFVIASLSVLLDPDLVVLSGGLAQDAAHLVEPLRRRVGELIPFKPEIRLGMVGADAGLLGADLLARAALETRAVDHAGAGLSAQSRGGTS